MAGVQTPDPDWEKLKARADRLYQDAQGPDVHLASNEEVAEALRIAFNERALDLASEHQLLIRMARGAYDKDAGGAVSPAMWHGLGARERQLKLIEVARARMLGCTCRCARPLF